MSESATGSGVDNAFARRCLKCDEEKPATDDFFIARSLAAGGGLDAVCRACMAVGRAEEVAATAAERAAGSLAAQNLAKNVKHGSAAHGKNEDIRAARAGAIVPASTTAHARTAISNALKNANNVVEANARLLVERMFVWALDDKHPLQKWALDRLADRVLPVGVAAPVASADASLPTDPAPPTSGEDGKMLSGPRAPGSVFISVVAAPPQPVAGGRVLDVKPFPEE